MDINPRALRFTSVNAALAKVDNVSVWHSDILTSTGGDFDLIVHGEALDTPPYGMAERIAAVVLTVTRLV